MRTACVDIGNTHTTFGVFKGGRLRLRWQLPTRKSATGKAAGFNIRQKRALQNADIGIICSVVPSATTPTLRMLKPFLKKRMIVVGRDLRVPLKNRYRRPKEVGQDRLVGAYAAWERYKKSCIIVDFGTAITVDLVSAPGAYRGGLIAPGPELALAALAKYTALLPNVDLRRPAEPLGLNTASSMRAGVLYGSAALCDGLIERIRKRYAPGARAIATGGAAKRIAPYSRHISSLRPNLVLEGLDLLARRTQ